MRVASLTAWFLAFAMSANAETERERADLNRDGATNTTDLLDLIRLIFQ